MTDIGQGFEGEVVAKYVIQVNLMFKPKSVNHLGAFNVWKKGGWFGRADELQSFCPKGGCLGVMPENMPVSQKEYDLIRDNPDDPTMWPRHIIQSMSHYYQTAAVCPVCKTMGIREQLPDSYGFNLTTDVISERAAQLFDVLGRDADILLVRTKEHAAFQKARVLLDEARTNVDDYRKRLETARDQDIVFYSLKKIIKDTAAGNTVAKRIKALIEA